MPNVICRAELHGSPTLAQYDEFHAGMKEFGLERTITRDGKVFHLPTGEYVGVNVSSYFSLLALQINTLAIRITRSQCKLTLTPVGDLDGIYIYGLVEDTSFESQLGALGRLASLFSAPPTGQKFDALSALCGLTSSGNAYSEPGAVPVSSAYGFLTGLKPLK